jgi:hypothetical protein
MSLESNVKDEWKRALKHCSQILVWLLDLAKLDDGRVDEGIVI